LIPFSPSFDLYQIEIRQYRVLNSPEYIITSLPDKGQSSKDGAFSMILSRAASRDPIEKFVDTLCEAMPLSAPRVDCDIAQLRSRMTDILTVSSLNLIASAHDVLSEHQQTFSSARTVSDIRSVFGDDVTVGPAGAVLVHMLSLGYYSTGERHSFVVALDNKDIDRIADVLQRAREK
jgi:hypothetical protein